MAEARSPAQLVWERFWRSWAARFALLAVASVFVASVYAPFLASETALVWIDAGGTSFPILADLFNTWNYPKHHDLLFNILALALPFLLVAGLLTRRWLGLGTRVLIGTGLVVILWLLAMVPMFPAPAAAGADADLRPLWRKRAPSGCTIGDLRDRQAALDEWTKAPADERGSQPDPLPTFTLFALIPHRHDNTYAGAVLQPPGTPCQATGHAFAVGTDTGGHDVAARMLFGGRVSLTIGLVATGLAMIIGTIIGGLSGFLGGKVDLILQRLVEIMMCFPTFILILVVVAMLGRDIFVIMTVIGLTSWAGTARLVRGEFLAHAVRDYVSAGRSLGLPTWRLMFVHILPNVMAPLLISASFGVAGAVGSESALSFLGLGDPNAATWGGLLEQGREQIHYAWLIYVPGLAVFLLVAALNVIGNHLREAMDVKGNG
jgi:peptide/nickel transport system permease protein